jgi:hypothetical protein
MKVEGYIELLKGMLIGGSVTAIFLAVAYILFLLSVR